MKSKSDRRVFLKNIGVGSAAALLPVTALSFADAKAPVDDNANPAAAIPGKRKYNTEYTGPHLNRVAFPIGGLGAGMFCMEGTGAISHMSVKNKPEIFNEPGMFAAICVKGVKNGAKLLEGPVPDWKKFGLTDWAGPQPDCLTFTTPALKPGFRLRTSILLTRTCH
jgi:hypothetical protein